MKSSRNGMTFYESLHFFSSEPAMLMVLVVDFLLFHFFSLSQFFRHKWQAGENIDPQASYQNNKTIGRKWWSREREPNQTISLKCRFRSSRCRNLQSKRVFICATNNVFIFAMEENECWICMALPKLREVKHRIKLTAHDRNECSFTSNKNIVKCKMLFCANPFVYFFFSYCLDLKVSAKLSSAGWARVQHFSLAFTFQIDSYFYSYGFS